MSSDEQEESLADRLAEKIEKQQEKFDRCDHQDIIFLEDDNHWECADCGLHFEPKQADSSRLPDIRNTGDYTSVMVKEYHPDWVRRSSVLKRMDKVFEEHDEEEYYRESWLHLQEDIKNMSSDTDLLEANTGDTHEQ